MGGGYIILKHLYLNDYAEFDSKIPYILFFHINHLACEISTVRTLALTVSCEHAQRDCSNAQHNLIIHGFQSNI